MSFAASRLPFSLLLVASTVIGAGCRSAPDPGTARGSRGDAATADASTRPSYGDERLAEAKQLFFAAVEGDRQALDRAAAVLDDLRAGDDARPQVTAYAGAVRLLSAPRAGLPWEMGRRTREGVGLMDRAVAEAPDDLEVRALRGLSYYRMPAFIGRGGMAAEDLAVVASRAPVAAAAGQLDPALAAAVLYHDGLLRARRGAIASADESFLKAVQLAPDTPAGRAAAQRLAR